MYVDDTVACFTRTQRQMGNTGTKHRNEIKLLRTVRN